MQKYKIEIAILSALILLFIFLLSFSESVRFFGKEHPGILIVAISVACEVICDFRAEKNLLERIKIFFGICLIIGLLLEIIEAAKSDIKVEKLREGNLVLQTNVESLNGVVIQLAHEYDLSTNALAEANARLSGLQITNLALANAVISLNSKLEKTDSTAQSASNTAQLTFLSTLPLVQEHSNAVAAAAAAEALAVSNAVAAAKQAAISNAIVAKRNAWRIKPDQQDVMMAAFRSPDHVKLLDESVTNENLLVAFNDSPDFAVDMASVLKKARFSVKIFPTNEPPFSGIKILVPFISLSSNALVNTGFLIRQALLDAGFGITVKKAELEPGLLKILVGSKPIITNSVPIPIATNSPPEKNPQGQNLSPKQRR